MILAVLLACNREAPPTALEAPTESPCHDTVPAAAASEGSLYDLEVPLETDRGERVDLASFRGQPVLVAMFYASCSQVCPLTIKKIQGTIARLPADTPVRVLLVSLDPARDDPAALARLKAEHGLDDRWTFARPTEDGVRDLAAALGVKYRRAPDGEFNHSAVVTLIDRNGVLTSRIDGLNAPTDALVEAASRM